DPDMLRHLKRIYVLRVGADLFIKRIDWRPEQQVMFLMSDNISHGGQTLIGPEVEDVAVIGEAVWWAHTERT
ncbi:MAG: hypothetical protein WBA67_14775, partial [Jannaschia sp.]